jgi:type IV pilus assembly protein PilE
MKTSKQTKSSGFTLVELMIAVAIISVIAVIAIPAYNGYIAEARLATARSNIDSLRLFLEDYRLDNGTYVGPSGSTTLSNLSEIENDFGWNPRQNETGFTYSVSGLTTTGYAINIQFGSTWVNCSETNNCTFSN